MDIANSISAQRSAAEREWPSRLHQPGGRPPARTGGIMFVLTVLRGGSFCVIFGLGTVAVVAAIQKPRITCLLMVPAMIYALPEHPRFDEFDLSSLKTILCGTSRWHFGYRLHANA